MIVKVLIAFFQTGVLMSVAMVSHPSRAARLGTRPALSQSPTTTVRSAPITVGDMAPDFTLEDQNKNKVTPSDARGKSPVVLVFYRGYW